MSRTQNSARRVLWITALLTAAALLAVLGVLRFVVLPDVDGKRNAVLSPGPHTASTAARDLLADAFVADLHADSLLWARDLSKRHARGHVDLVRLREAGVDLQVFGVVTRVPNSMNYANNSPEGDRLPLLFIASWRPVDSWFSPKGRALAQANELHDLERRGLVSVVKRKADLAREGTQALLSLEGMHALEGNPDALDELYAAGFRMMGLAHLFDNDVAGSAHGLENYGLTALGRTLLGRMEQLGITVDLAHASAAAIDDVLDAATQPVVFSHGGVQGTCPGPRNLSDAQLERIAHNGGVVGIGVWKAAICDVSVRGFVRAVQHAVNVAGIDHVALGSDFDGYVATPFDVTGIAQLVDGLIDAGFSEQAVRRVLGGNVRRVLSANLPD